MNYWINTVSYDHLKNGMEDGFTQANHGKRMNLQRLSKGDLIVFYSPRTHFRGGDPLQQFTAVARVTDEEPYQAEMHPDFHPWRRRVDYLPCPPTSIRLLIADLDFIHDKQKWGFPFRRGLFNISEKDFYCIANAMHVVINPLPA